MDERECAELAEDIWNVVKSHIKDDLKPGVARDIVDLCITSHDATYWNDKKGELWDYSDPWWIDHEYEKE